MANRQIIVHRAARNETTIQNSIIWAADLSNMARFTLIAMLSLPESWDYSVRGMAAMLSISKDTMSKYINELERAGYISRQQQVKGNGGKFEKSTYILTDTPWEFGEEVPCPKNSDTDAESAPPCPNFPAPENSPQYITDRETKDIPPKAPQGGRRRKNEPKDAPEWRPDRFAGFWVFYPRGEAKQAAIRAWDKLKPSDELIDTMAQALSRQVASASWQEGYGIPYASTWINQRRWEDELKSPSPPRAGTDTTALLGDGGYWL